MAKVDAVLGLGGFAWMLQVDVLVHLGPGLGRMAGLPNVDLTAFM
jgi:hypothetical protein